MWLDALQLAAAPEAREEELLRSRQLLQHASTIKEGWGWGVNNGDIHLALASVNLCLWASSWADADASADAGDAAAAVALRRELLDEAEEAVALCQSRDGSQGPASKFQSVNLPSSGPRPLVQGDYRYRHHVRRELSTAELRSCQNVRVTW